MQKFARGHVGQSGAIEAELKRFDRTGVGAGNLRLSFSVSNSMCRCVNGSWEHSYGLGGAFLGV